MVRFKRSWNDFREGNYDDVQVVLNVPFAEKDEAKKLGALWSPENRTWWCRYGEERKFERWLPMTSWWKDSTPEQVKERSNGDTPPPAPVALGPGPPRPIPTSLPGFSVFKPGLLRSRWNWEKATDIQFVSSRSVPLDVTALDPQVEKWVVELLPSKRQKTLAVTSRCHLDHLVGTQWLNFDGSTFDPELRDWFVTTWKDHLTRLGFRELEGGGTHTDALMPAPGRLPWHNLSLLRDALTRPRRITLEELLAAESKAIREELELLGSAAVAAADVFRRAAEASDAARAAVDDHPQELSAEQGDERNCAWDRLEKRRRESGHDIYNV